jgi:hypothetical protein
MDTKNKTAAPSGSINTPIFKYGVACRQPVDRRFKRMFAQMLHANCAEEHHHRGKE